MKTNSVSRALMALGHESRLAIFTYLVKQGKEGVPAGDIGTHLAIPGATLSFHLTQLVNAKLIQPRKDGRTIFYSVRYKRLKKFIAYLKMLYRENKPISEDTSLRQAAGEKE